MRLVSTAPNLPPPVFRSLALSTCFNCRHIYLLLFTDIDNNGFLDSNDFECMALRACIIEGKGDCNPAKLAEYQHIMRSLWDELSEMADFDKVMWQKPSISIISLPSL